MGKIDPQVVRGAKGGGMRVVEIGNEPWFSASDVCAILNLATDTAGSLSNILDKLDPSERMALPKRTTPNLVLFTGTAAKVALITESGVCAAD